MADCMADCLALPIRFGGTRLATRLGLLGLALTLGASSCAHQGQSEASDQEPHLAQQRYQRVIREACTPLGTRPSDSDCCGAWIGRARSLAMLGDRRRARLSFQEAAKRCSNPKAALAGVADMQERPGEVELADVLLAVAYGMELAKDQRAVRAMATVDGQPLMRNLTMLPVGQHRLSVAVSVAPLDAAADPGAGGADAVGITFSVGQVKFDAATSEALRWRVRVRDRRGHGGAPVELDIRAEPLAEFMAPEAAHALLIARAPVPTSWFQRDPGLLIANLCVDEDGLVSSVDVPVDDPEIVAPAAQWFSTSVYRRPDKRKPFCTIAYSGRIVSSTFSGVDFDQ